MGCLHNLGSGILHKNPDNMLPKKEHTQRRKGTKAKAQHGAFAHSLANAIKTTGAIILRSKYGHSDARRNHGLQRHLLYTSSCRKASNLLSTKLVAHSLQHNNTQT